MSDIPKAIRVALAQNGWKQKDLAEKMGVTEGAVHHWVSGDRSLTQTTLSKIAGSFDLKISELVALGE